MSEPFDIYSHSPDDGHEAIRVAVLKAIDDSRINTDDLGMSFALADTLFQLLDGALTQVAELTSRVAALEAATTPPAEEPTSAN